MDVASGLEAIRGSQAILQALTALSLTSYQFPQSAKLTDDLRCDFLIVGGGTAGSVLANRLSENPDYEVCMFEAGGDPPLESVLSGLLAMLPLSAYDYNMTSENDYYADQVLETGVVHLTLAKMLGGISSLDHLFNIRGVPYDYSRWADAANCTSWNYENLLPYFMKSENCKDEEILNSVYGKYHGTEGPLKMAREPHTMNVPLLNAFAELGYDLPIDVNNPDVAFGYTEGIYSLYDGTRQSAATTYLNAILSRPNVHVFKNARVLKINIDSDNVATGIQVLMSDETTATVNAEIEVIVSAGAIHTPHLLMLSGIGDKTHLESFDIPVVADLPVGQNLQDHPFSVIMYKMNATNATTPVANPHKYPLPTLFGLAALNESQGYADYVNFVLSFPHDSTDMIGFCAHVLGLNYELCQSYYDAGKGREISLLGVSLLRPESRGQVLLNSTDPLDEPIVKLGKLSNDNDLVNFGKYFQHAAKVENTEYFKSVDAEMVAVPDCTDLITGSDEYWQCVARSMSFSIWNFCGTCSMGTVVDARLNVKGVSGLRVVDASIAPNLASTKIIAGVYAIAEKASDMIKEDYTSSS